MSTDQVQSGFGVDFVKITESLLKKVKEEDRHSSQKAEFISDLMTWANDLISVKNETILAPFTSKATFRLEKNDVDIKFRMDIRYDTELQQWVGDEYVYALANGKLRQKIYSVYDDNHETLFEIGERLLINGYHL